MIIFLKLEMTLMFELTHLNNKLITDFQGIGESTTTFAARTEPVYPPPVPGGEAGPQTQQGTKQTKAATRLLHFKGYDSWDLY